MLSGAREARILCSLFLPLDPSPPSIFYTRRHQYLEIITVIRRTSNSLQHLNGKTIISVITDQELSYLMGCQLLEVHHGPMETVETYHLRVTDCAIVSL